MKANKTLFAAVGVLILAGATTLILLNENSGTVKPAAGSSAGNRKAAAANPETGQAGDNPARSSERVRTRQAPANADLVARNMAKCAPISPNMPPETSWASWRTRCGWVR